MAETPTADAPVASAPADINSALDAIEARETTTPAPEPTPKAAAPAVTPEAPAAPAAPEADPFDSGADTFDRAYVEKLRQESARYRTAAKPFADTFEGVADGDRDAFLGLVELYKTDPAAAADWMESNAKALRDGTEPPAAPEAPGDADKPLTRAEFNQLLAERESAKAQDQRVADIHKEVRDLGIDPTTPAGRNLMFRAINEHEGDIAAAHKAVTDELAAMEKATIEKYLADKAAGANGPSPVTGNGPSTEAPAEIKSIKDAKAALEARFDDLGFK